MALFEKDRGLQDLKENDNVTKIKIMKNAVYNLDDDYFFSINYKKQNMVLRDIYVDLGKNTKPVEVNLI